MKNFDLPCCLFETDKRHAPGVREMVWVGNEMLSTTSINENMVGTLTVTEEKYKRAYYILNMFFFQ